MKRRTARFLKILTTKRVLFIFLIILLILIVAAMQKFLICLLLILTGGLSVLYKRVLSIGLGIDLMTFNTIIAAMKYGAITGSIVGVATVLFGYIISNKVAKSPQGMVINVGLFILIAVVAATQPITAIVATGIIISIAYAIIYLPISLASGGNLQKLLIFIPTHIAWNVFLFFHFGPLI